jgi:D-3-phosphoglycerate dehydrogenase
MTPHKVLVTDIVFEGLDIEREVLEPLDAHVVLAAGQDVATLAREAADADAVMVCFAPVPAEVVDAAAAGGCRVIARYGIGYDNVDVAAASRHGIVVTNVPDYCLDEVADHTMALLLAAARGVVAASREVAAGGWTIEHSGVHRLAGRRLALIGLGGIGRRVAARAQAFGLEVVGFDPFLPEGTGIDGVRRVGSLAEAFAGAHFISLHVPMTPENEQLIDTDSLALADSAPILINTSRGGLVDLDAVAVALEDGVLSGAALDVTDPEPLPLDDPLRDDPRVIVTPHMAFHSVEATQELQRRTALEVARALRGEPADRPVNSEALRA